MTCEARKSNDAEETLRLLLSLYQHLSPHISFVFSRSSSTFAFFSLPSLLHSYIHSFPLPFPSPSFPTKHHTLPQQSNQMAIDFSHWPSKVANILVYVTLLSGNLYSTFGGDQDQDSPYDSKHQSYITPASFTFYIWTLIHFLLGGMVVYQWFTDKIHQAVGWHFVMASVFNALWLGLWVSFFFWSSFLAVFFFSYLTLYFFENHKTYSLA